MKRIIVLMIFLTGCAGVNTRNEIHLMSVTNHTQPGVTSGDGPTVELRPGLTVPAYNEENIGIAFGQSRKNTWWMGGRYKNSFWGNSNILLSGVGVRIGNFMIGPSFGFVDGYTDQVEAAGFYFIKTDDILILTTPDGYHLVFTPYSWK